MIIRLPVSWKGLCVPVSLALACLFPSLLPAIDGEPPKTISDQQERLAPLPDYRFVPGDTLEFKFFYNPDMNDLVQIRPDGKIAMPLIGDVELAGLTVTAASRMIEEKYTPHLKTPRVTIQIKNFAGQKIFIGGEVLRPGVVHLSSELTLLNAILEAGGGKSTASTSTIILIRKTPENTPQMQKIPLKNEKGEYSEQAMNLVLRPYDVVIVPESKIAKVNRWVDQYLRQTIPFTLYGSFNYVLNPGIIGK